MKENAKAYGSCLLSILWYVYSLLIIGIPLNAALEHYVPMIPRFICILLLEIAYIFFPTIVFTIMHLLLLVGIYFVYANYSTAFFIFYIILLLSFYIRTFVLVIIPSIRR